MIILEEDPIAEVAKLLKCEVYQVFYLAAQDEGVGSPGVIAAHRVEEYRNKGYSNTPEYVQRFCEEMKRVLKRGESGR